MKRLVFATALLTLTACPCPEAKALPRPYRPFAKALLKSDQKKQSPKPLDTYRSGNKTMVLHSGGISFHQEGKPASIKLQGARIVLFPSDIVFHKPALAGRFIDKGTKAVVLFQDGIMSRFGFEDGEGPTFDLFHNPSSIPSEVGMHVTGNIYWLVLYGTPQVIRVEWNGETDVALHSMSCKKINKIEKEMKVICAKDSCSIYQGSGLLEEIKQ